MTHSFTHPWTGEGGEGGKESLCTEPGRFHQSNQATKNETRMNVHSGVSHEQSQGPSTLPCQTHEDDGRMADLGLGRVVSGVNANDPSEVGEISSKKSASLTNLPKLSILFRVPRNFLSQSCGWKMTHFVHVWSFRIP